VVLKDCGFNPASSHIGLIGRQAARARPFPPARAHPELTKDRALPLPGRLGLTVALCGAFFDDLFSHGIDGIDATLSIVDIVIAYI
jgi:hypothetical protein